MNKELKASASISINASVQVDLGGLDQSREN